MFGYIRPLRSELKVSEFERFSSVYCGLCHTLKKRYGFVARFTLNFDFTFLTMLLATEADSACTGYKRCIVLRKKRCTEIKRASEIAADYSIILAYWKLKDSISDEGFLKKLYLYPCALFFKRKYKKAALLQPDFDTEVRRELLELKELEQLRESSMDKVADKFAKILQRASGDATNSGTTALSQLLYHMGRLIYILDAYDDLEDDCRRGRYNPLAFRFCISEGHLSNEDIEYIKNTMKISAGIVAADFELLPATQFHEILENIIYLGLPEVIELVISRKWSQKGKKINRL